MSKRYVPKVHRLLDMGPHAHKTPRTQRAPASLYTHKEVYCNTAEDPNRRCRAHSDGSKHLHRVAIDALHSMKELLGK